MTTINRTSGQERCAYHQWKHIYGGFRCMSCGEQKAHNADACRHCAVNTPAPAEQHCACGHAQSYHVTMQTMAGEWTGCRACTDGAKHQFTAPAEQRGEGLTKLKERAFKALTAIYLEVPKEVADDFNRCIREYIVALDDHRRTAPPADEGADERAFREHLSVPFTEEEKAIVRRNVESLLSVFDDPDYDPLTYEQTMMLIGWNAALRYERAKKVGR